MNSAAIWQEVVEIDTDIVAVCRRLEERDPQAYDGLIKMLDALLERKRTLLERERAAP